jgi:hypothetical protein
MRKLSQSGFGHIALVLLVLVVAVVGFAGYTVWKAGQKPSSSDSTQQATVPATIKTKADLTQTSKFLDTTATELDSNLDPSSLDGSINQLL